MRDLHNEEATEEVPKCAPEPGYDAEKKPDFNTLDTKGDGVIDEEEAHEFCEKACIPDELGTQLFSESDENQDKVIDQEEFESAGEDTANEKAMDEALEETSAGDDEVNTVDNPPITEFDGNKDGVLDENEAHDVFEHELERRTDNAEVPDQKITDLQPEIDKAIDKVDTNDDGVIDGGEYVAQPEDADDSDLGKELQEVAGVDEDKGEIDDLARSGGPANAAPAAAPALLISHSRHLQRSHGLRGRRAQRAGLTQQRQKVKYAEAMMVEAQRQQRLRKAALAQNQRGKRAKVKYAEAIMAEAKRQQLLREAAFTQHERHLHHAMMMHKQAKHHLNRGRRAFHLHN